MTLNSIKQMGYITYRHVYSAAGQELPLDFALWTLGSGYVLFCFVFFFFVHKKESKGSYGQLVDKVLKRYQNILVKLLSVNGSCYSRLTC